MNMEEQQLISRLFDRMESATPQAKDYDAERLIQQRMRQIADAPYVLVQSVLVQQHALEAAADRLRELEDQVASLQSSASRPQAGAGSFLGGALGSSSPWSRGSVPATGSDRMQSQPAAQPAMPPSMPQPVAQPPSQGGGFLASALSTASGVAGGVLLADGLRSLLGGGSSTGGLFGGLPRQSGDSGMTAELDRARDDAQDARDDADKARSDLAADDAALDDAQDQLDDQDQVDDQQDDDSWSVDDTVDV